MRPGCIVKDISAEQKDAVASGVLKEVMEASEAEWWPRAIDLLLAENA